MKHLLASHGVRGSLLSVGAGIAGLLHLLFVPSMPAGLLALAGLAGGLWSLYGRLTATQRVAITPEMLPALRPLPDGKHWQLTEEVRYHSAHLRQAIVVPVGFVTDFASVPWWLHWLYSPWGRYGVPAIIHDFLYRTQPPGISKGDADRVFLDAMPKWGTHPITTQLMWRAVDLFGATAWEESATRLRGAACLTKS